MIKYGINTFIWARCPDEGLACSACQGAGLRPGRNSGSKASAMSTSARRMKSTLPLDLRAAFGAVMGANRTLIRMRPSNRPHRLSKTLHRRSCCLRGRLRWAALCSGAASGSRRRKCAKKTRHGQEPGVCRRLRREERVKLARALEPLRNHHPDRVRARSWWT